MEVRLSGIAMQRSTGKLSGVLSGRYFLRYEGRKAVLLETQITS